MHVFAYGSLLDPRCLEEVVGHPHFAERLRARLNDYARRTTGYPYPFIVESIGDAVDGVLIMDLDADDLAALDRYEEVDKGLYRRAEVEVETWGSGPRGVSLRAYAYVAGPELRRFIEV